MSYPIFDLRQSMTRTRVVTNGEPADSAQTFIGHLYPRQDPDNDGTDESPRSLSPYILWYSPAGGRTLVPDLGPGDRIVNGADEYEVLAAPFGKRAGERVLVHEAPLQHVDVLYPILATLQELGGSAVGFLPVALWTTASDVNTDRGEYDDATAEAGAEHYDALRVPNRELAVGDDVYRIREARLHRDHPRVECVLRKVSRGT